MPTHLKTLILSLALALPICLTGAPVLAQSSDGTDTTTGTSTGATTGTEGSSGTGTETEVALPPLTDLEKAIKERIENDQGTAGAGNTGDQQLVALYTYYDGRRYKPIWVTANGANTKALDFVDALFNSETDALYPEDYHIDVLSPMLNGKTLQELANLEVELSKTLLVFGEHLSAGRVEPNKINREISMFPVAADPSRILNGADTAENIETLLARLAPQTPNYARLKVALQEYRDKAAHGGWAEFPAGDVIKPNYSDATRVAALRKRMIDGGDLKPGEHEGDIYDGALVEAVKRFQERHGLDVDGVIGPTTIKAMNVPASVRVRQMELNMERRRWMEDDLGSYYVFVNLADQYLKVVDKEKTVHTARLVVGKPYHRTPVFTRKMTYTVINPYWNVPFNIAVNEYLPKLRNNPGALAAQNIHVYLRGRQVSPYAVNWAGYGRREFPFRLRQEPGRRNALGRIKFMFPNPFSVYIHDTPSKSLFKRSRRVFSHGCMRVQDPFDLAQVLLGHEGWDRKQIDRIAASGKQRVIKFKAPIPVHITYLTAWVNKDGSVHFRADVYGRDKLLDKALTRVTGDDKKKKKS